METATQAQKADEARRFRVVNPLGLAALSTFISRGSDVQSVISGDRFQR